VATSATWACYRARRIRLVRMHAANLVGTPRALARSPILLLLQLFFLLFALSQLQLKPSILKSYFFNSESIS
jgi:hypothetical protein